MQVRGREQGVVVEHLLEVRDEPDRVDGVAVEAAAELVVDAARGHPVERRRRHLERRLVPRAPPGRAGGTRAPEAGRELGRAAEPAVLARRTELRERRRPRSRAAPSVRSSRRRGIRGGGAPDRLDELGRLRGDVAAALRVGARHRRRAPAGTPADRGSAPAGSRCRRRRARPSGVRNTVIGQPPWPGQGDDRAHVDRVDVRALLPVDLDADEPLVHERCRVRVLERLVLHHVAPVAGGVADREEDRPVLGASALEGLLAPRVPVDGVVRVLEQVGARLPGETVHATSIAPARGRPAAAACNHGGGVP